MGHTEVLQYLKDKCLTGSHEYYSIAQIRSYFIEHPNQYVSIENIAKNMTVLQRWGVVECKTLKNINYYRYKKSILDQSSI